MIPFDERFIGWLLDGAVRVAILLLFGLALMRFVRQPAKQQMIQRAKQSR
jgi:hypothetical protein